MKPVHCKTLLWLVFSNFSSNMVEAAGIEPASASSLPSALHAYFVYCLTFHWPDKQGLEGELALSLTASTTSGVWQLSHESRTQIEYMGTSAPGQAILKSS
jgi:hypothetical protein